ncbi:MAG: hypothetical protein RL701_4786 [Pseudomonadota bacterium]
MRRSKIVASLCVIALAGCGDDDDGHDHSEAGSGASHAGTGGKSGSGGVSTAGQGAGGAGAKGGTGGKGGAGGTTYTGGAGGSNNQGTQDVTIRFKAKVGSKDFACGTSYSGVGTKGTTVEPKDFRFFVRDLKLRDGDREVPVKLKASNKWQSETVALLDFEDAKGACGAEGNPETNFVVEGTVPKGNYNGISFSNAVPDDESHADPTTLKDPLKTYASMSWGWLFGFRFVIAEVVGKADDADASEPPMAWLHLGSGSCTNNAVGVDAGLDFMAPPVSCLHPNHNHIRLDNYKVGESVIVADFGAVFAQSDVSITEGCHGSGDACTPLWKAFGLDTQGKALDTQAVYHVE